MKTILLACALSTFCQTATAQSFEVTLDTAPLVGHPAGPFSILFAFTDGNGVGDANNTVTISNVQFGGGSALGSPIVLGGASGSLETGVTITDSSFLSFSSEGFVPGSQLSFSVSVTLNDDAGGIPDRLTFSIVDYFGVPVPTLAPVGDYFMGVDLRSTGPVFDAYGSDPSRSLSVGGPVSIPTPTLAEVGSPSLSGAASVVSYVNTSLSMNLQLTNIGTSDAFSTVINTLTFRTLGGKGSVTLASPQLPIIVGTISVNSYVTVPLTLNVPTTVTRFSMTEGGTMQDSLQNKYNFSLQQAVVP